MSKKLKIFLETSAISSLEQLNVPQREADMKELWKIRDEKSLKTKDMTFDELREYLSKSNTWFRERLGKENFHPTGDPNTKVYIPPKNGSFDKRVKSH